MRERESGNEGERIEGDRDDRYMRTYWIKNMNILQKNVFIVLQSKRSERGICSVYNARILQCATQADI